MQRQAYSAERTGLLIVDPYNDFMSEGGKLYEAIKPTADACGMFDNLRKIIPAARAARIQLFIVPHHRPHAHDFDGWQHMTPFQKAGVPMKAFERGTWGGEFNSEFGTRLPCDAREGRHCRLQSGGHGCGSNQRADVRPCDSVYSGVVESIASRPGMT